MDIIMLTKTLSEDSIHQFVNAMDRLYPLVLALPPKQDGADDQEILKINAGFHPDIEPGSRDEMIAAGCLEWLKDPTPGNEKFFLSNNRVKDLHRRIFKYSDRDKGTRGNYRGPVDERLKTIYDATNDQLKRGDRHPLLVVSLFRIAFLEEMPFITGNGLIANLLCYALLLGHGYGFISQLPLLASLNNADGGSLKNQLSIIPQELSRLIEIRINTRNPAQTAKKQTPYLNPRQKTLLNLIKEHAPIKISDIMEHLPLENRNTIKKDLLLLRELSFILSQGEGRGVVYVLPA